MLSRRFTKVLAAVVLIAAPLALTVASTASAATCSTTAVTSGDWSDDSTWNVNGVPGAGNDVCIPSGITVSLDRDEAASTVDVATGGTLEFNNNTLEAISLANSGTVFGSGSFRGNFTNSGTLVVGDEGAPSANTFEVFESFVQTAAGTLKVDWVGPADNDRLMTTISGVSLAGKIDVKTNGYNPVAGDSFRTIYSGIGSTTGSATVTDDIIGVGLTASIVFGDVVVTAAAAADAPSTVSGKIYNDFDNYGEVDAGEYGVAGIEVYLDIDGDGGARVAGDPFATTNASGTYTLSGVPAGGPYIVNVTLLANATTTIRPRHISSTSNPGFTPVITGGQTITDVNGAIAYNGWIAGKVSNASGGVENVELTIDRNADGTKEKTRTNELGDFIFRSVPNGTFTFGPSITSTPANASATIVAGSNVTGKNFTIAGSTPTTTTTAPPSTTTTTTAPGSTTTTTTTAPPSTTTTTTTAPPSTTTTTTPPNSGNAAPVKGYMLAARDGGIFTYGDQKFYGSMGGKPLNKPIVGAAGYPDGSGYWLVASDGGIFSFGNAKFYGSTGSIKLNSPVVGMAATRDGGGYWLVAADGGVFAFGNAKFEGSMGGKSLNSPIVGITADVDGEGYMLVAADGGLFSYKSVFKGSAGGTRLNSPIVGMSADPDGEGYWLVAADGGIFAYGATFFGSAGGIKINAPIVGMAVSSDSKGYYLVGTDGGIYAFGAAFYGSAGNLKLNEPILGIATPSGRPFIG